MILILNCMLDDGLADSFDRAVVRILKKPAAAMVGYRISKPGKRLDTEQVSRVIISGSEASACDELSWYASLEDLVRSFVAAEVPLLGICFGHQFLVRTLAGKEKICQADQPEFGWVSINFQPNPLFDGITDLVSMVSHHDEVVDISPDFNILASSRRCAVQGIQYKSLPVYGIQFHPEYGFAEAGEIFDRVKEEDPRFTEKWVNDLQILDHYFISGRILKNFIKLKP